MGNVRHKRTIKRSDSNSNLLKFFMLKKFFISGNYVSPDPPPSARDFIISLDGVGDGLTESTPGPPSLLADAIAMGILVTGSVVKFKCGEQYFLGDITLPNAADITYTFWGSGAAPRLYGSDVTTSWTNEGGGLYSKILTTTPHWLYVNDVAAKLAASAWIQTTAIVSSTVFRINPATLSALGGSALVGAKCRPFAYNWYIPEGFTVTAVDTGTGNITLNTPYNIFGTVIGGMFVIFYDQLQLLTDNNEFYYDPALQKLYYKSSVDPSTLIMRVGYKADGFIVRGHGTIVDGIRMMHYNYALRSQGGISTAAKIRNFIATNCKKIGLLFSSANETEILNSQFIDHGDVGFYLTGNDTFAEDTLVQNIGMDLNYGIGNSGFTMVGTNAEFNRMRCENIAWVGFVITGANWRGNKIIVKECCRRLRDGGAFYSSGSTANPSVSTNYGGILRNLIAVNLDLPAEGNLTPERTIGAYVDNRNDDTTVEDCTIVGFDFSTLINWNTRRSKHRRNIFIGAKEIAVLYREDTGAVASPLFTNNNGNILEENIIGMRSNVAECVEARHRNGNASYNPFSSGGNSNSNKYVKPYGTLICNSRPTESGTLTQYTLATWRTRNGEDEGSSERVNYIGFSNTANALEEVKVEINETDSPVQFTVPTGYTDADGNAFVNPVTIGPYSSLPYFKNTGA